MGSRSLPVRSVDRNILTGQKSQAEVRRSPCGSVDQNSVKTIKLHAMAEKAIHAEEAEAQVRVLLAVTKLRKINTTRTTRSAESGHWSGCASLNQRVRVLVRPIFQSLSFYLPAAIPTFGERSFRQMSCICSRKRAAVSRRNIASPELHHNAGERLPRLMRIETHGSYPTSFRTFKLPPRCILSCVQGKKAASF